MSQLPMVQTLYPHSCRILGTPPDRAHGYVQWWWVAARWWPCPLLETQGLYPMGTARGGQGEDPEVSPGGKRGGRAVWISGVRIKPL